MCSSSFLSVKSMWEIFVRIREACKVAQQCFKGNIKQKVCNANGYGLVVMTLASHARGRGFDPLFPYAFYFFAYQTSDQKI